MKQLGTFFIALVAALVVCGNLGAATIKSESTMTLSDLPPGDTDTLFIQLDPFDGTVDGVAGSTVGWGFAVDWTSTNGDYLSFTSSSLGSIDDPETNPDLLAPGGYTDFIGYQGGPVDFSLGPGSSDTATPTQWLQPFDGISQGVGSYQITSDPTVAVPGAEDTGEITFNFQVYDGDPLDGAMQIGDPSYSYYATSTQFSVSVDPPPSVTPEPGAAGLLLAGMSLLAARLYRASKATSNVGGYK